MTARERVLTAVEHKEPDRVPLMYRDVPEVRARLNRDLMIESDDDLYEAFGIDFRWVEPRWVGRSQRTTTNERTDHWGVEWKYTLFSESAGYWNETSHPLADENDPAAVCSVVIPEVGWWDFGDLMEQTARYGDYAVMTAPGVSSPGILQSPIQPLIGAERSLVDLYNNPEFMHALVNRVMEFILPFIEKLVGSGRIDFFRMGDDFGAQHGPLIGLDLWSEFFRDPMKTLADTARKAGALFYLHSCGSVRNLIPSLIEIGVDVLDPFQITAAGMDPAGLKRDFGDHLCFSGGVDEQDLLPRGTPAQIREEVWRLLDIMMPGGGFILGPTHNFQDDVPTANIVAMYEAAKTWPG